MRIRRLDIARFGRFTDQAYDFGAAGDRPDFHIVYGPNEAGKTTTMEAILRLFYGFPNREPYDFLHGRPNLQITADLEAGGQVHRFTRLPKRAGDLLDGAGAALPGTALSAHLAGLTEADYRKLLCLDDDTIEQGGEEIANAKGEIGRLLFSAAAGVADLSGVLDGVREEADDLWRKQGRKTRIAELKRALKEVEAQIRDGDTSAAAWKGLKAALRRAKTQEDAIRAERDSARRDLALAEGKARALPRLQALADLDAALAPFAAYPARLDHDPEDLVTLATQEAQARAEIARLTTHIEETRAARAQIARSPERLALAEALDALDADRSREMTAAMDIERRRDAVAEAEARMRRSAAEIGVDAAVVLDAPPPSQGQIATLEATREALRAAEQAAATASEEQEIARRRLDEAARDLDARMAEAPPDAGIDAILQRHDADTLARDHAAVEAALRAARGEADTALQALAAAGTGRLDTLPPCTVSLSDAESWAQKAADLRTRIEQAREARDTHRADADARAAQVAHLAEAAGIVPDAEAAERRADRDTLWQDHRATLDAETADRFEAAMRAFDTMAERRLAGATDLGRLRQIQEEEAALRARAQAADQRLTEAQAEHEALCTKVAEAASCAGRPDLADPDAWRGWVAQHDTAATAARRLEALQADSADILDRAQALQDALAPLLGSAAQSFAALLDRARSRAEAERSARTGLQQASTAKAEAQEADARRTAALAEAQTALEDAQDAWAAAVADLYDGSVAEAALRPGLQPIRDLREAATDRQEKRDRIKKLEGDRKRYAAFIADLAAQHGIAEGATPLETDAALRAAAQAAAEAEETHTRLGQTLEADERALAQAQKTLETIARRVAVLAAAFPADAGIETLADLRRATSRALDVIAKRAERKQAEAAILADLGVADLDAAREILADATLPDLQAKADALRTGIEAHDTALTQATEARVTAAHALDAVAGDAEIAKLRERQVTLELELEEAARAYLDRALGHRLAEAAIRRYRDAHRSGMMQATEACFATLTHGAYPRLTTQAEGEGEALLAIDAQGSAKRVAEMSKGTRFQLYLALRAAAYRQMAAQGVRLPFFCDDIFETFDEDRTAAACTVMEEIGRNGQAIYLTHHRHVVDIAQQVCTVPPIVHRIADGG